MDIKNLYKAYILLLVLVISLSGCFQPVNTDVSSSEPISETPTIRQESSLPESSLSEEISLPESSLSDEISNNDEYYWSAEKVIIDDRNYFLDERKSKTIGNTTGYMLCYRLNDSETDIPVNILAYSIAKYGDYIYALTSNDYDYFSKLINNDIVYRIDKNGNKKFVCNGDFKDMIEYALHSFDNNLYFTRFNENVIYKADLNCEKIEQIPFDIPEQKETFAQLKITIQSNFYSQYEILNIENDSINIFYNILNESNLSLFRGRYRFSTTDKNIEKDFSSFRDNRIMIGEWLYYLDLNHPIESGEEPLYDIHRIKPDGKDDFNLKISCFRFDIVGNYIYLDTDVTYGDFMHWLTYRYNIDGTGKKELEYGDMMRYTDGRQIYFAEMWDNTIYVADAACNVLEKIKVILPDEQTLRKTLGGRYDLVWISITDREGDWLTFDYTIGDPGGRYYDGYYRLNLKSKKIEKFSGEYDLPD
ncbi:MAG: hypothetical protein ACYCYI_13015 [Saccharofermentanales bacterium]